MKTSKLTILLCFFTMHLWAQNIYVVNDLNELKIVDVSDFSITNLFSIEVTASGFIVDLAFSPAGNLYGVTENKTLIEIDLANESFQVIETLPVSNNYPGLICNSDNELITATFLGGDVFIHDLDTGNTIEDGDGLSTPGDFTYFKGNIIFPSVLDDDVKAYDGVDITVAGCSGPQVFAFVNVFTDCDTNAVYGIDETSKVYLYDIETSDTDLVADLLSEVGPIFGAATMSEYMASACALENLTEVDCTLGGNELDFTSLQIYPNPVDQLLKFQSVKDLADSEYIIRDLQGRVTSSGIINSEEINVGGLNSGIYFLEINSDKNLTRYMKKFIKI